jgi:hypothetical protein
MAIGAPGCDKLIDLLVEAKAGRKFAYWTFDRQQRARSEILACQALPGVHVCNATRYFVDRVTV